jgi:hypothetical protein
MASTSKNSDGIIDETDDLAHLEFGNGQNDLQDIIDELQIQVSHYAPIINERNQILSCVCVI